MEASSANALVQKIDHGLPDVRSRAIQSLHSKLKNGLATPAKLAKETDVCQALLRLCDAPALLTEQAVQLLGCFVDCGDSFLCLQVLGLEEKVRYAADHMERSGRSRKLLDDVMTKILSSSRRAEVPSSSSQVSVQGEAPAAKVTSRLPFMEHGGPARSLESGRFKHLPKLRVVGTEKEVEQTLFEIGFRLAHGGDEFALLLALQQLSQCVCIDHPPQVIFQQNSLFGNLLRLLHLEVSEKVRRSALCCLQRVLSGLKSSVALAQRKDFLSPGGADHDRSLDQSTSQDLSYPKPLYIPGADDGGEAAQKDLLDLPAYTHMTVLHLLSLLCDAKMHHHVTKSIFCALDLLRVLGHASYDDACFKDCITEYLWELQKVFQKHSKSWAKLHGERERDEAKSPFSVDVFDQNLVYIVAEVLKLRKGCDAKMLVPRKMQSYLCTFFNNECVAMCSPQSQECLFPYIEQIDGTLTLKKDKSKEVLANFLRLSKDLRDLRLNSNSSIEENMKSAKLVLGILPTVIGMGDTEYFDHIFRLILRLLMRTNWKFVMKDGCEPTVYADLQTAFQMILSQSCVKVRAKAYRIWLEAIVECAPGDYKVVLNPLTNRSIMSIVVVFGLNDTETKDNVSQILFYGCRDSSVRIHVNEWISWFECHKEDSTIGSVMQSILIAVNEDMRTENDAMTTWSWHSMRPVYMAAFSSDRKVREDALSGLYGFLEAEGHATDVNQFSYLASQMEYKLPTQVQLDTQEDMPESEIRTLVDIFKNERIDLAIQKAAAIQLLLALQRSARTQEISIEVLDSCASILQKCALGDHIEYDEEYLGTILLILVHSVKGGGSSIPWFTEQSAGFFRVYSLLLFHSSITVQQSAAVILFSVLLNEEKNRVLSAGLALRGKQDPGDVLIPDAFESLLRPPCPCAFLQVCVEGGNFDLVEEIVSKVKDTIDARNAIKALIGGETLPSDAPLEIQEMVERLHPKCVLGNALAKIKSAKSHEDCKFWVLLLLNYCSCSAESLEEFSAMNWLEPLQTFLSSSPTSKKDWELWLMMFTMISEVLTKSSTPHALLMNLVLLYDDAILPSVLQEEFWEVESATRLGLKAQHKVSETEALARKIARTESISAAMETFVALLKANRSCGSIAVQKYMVDSLGSEENISTLADFALCDSWNYGLRTLALQGLVELLTCYLDLKALEVYQYTPSDLDSVFSSIVPKIIRNECCIARGSFGHGRGILHHALKYLKQVTNLDRKSWVSVWAETDCTFWVSKLLRDRETLVRKTSLQILCALSNPISGQLISMLQKCWPDRLYAVVQIAFDETECDLVRAKAMQILSLSLALEGSTINEEEALVSETYPTESSIRKNIFQTIEEHRFWEILKNSLSWNRSQLMGGILSIVAEMLVLDTHYVFQKCKISQICKVATAVFNSSSKQLDQKLSEGESYFDSVIPLSMALNVLQTLLQKEKLFSKVLQWIPSMNVCNIYCSFSVRLASVLKKEMPFRVSYYSACLPLLMQFSAVIANLMHALLGEFKAAKTTSVGPTMTEEEMQNSIAQVCHSIRFTFTSQILPVQVKVQCCKLLEITLQVNDLASVAMSDADKQFEGSEATGAVLCHHLVAESRAMRKNMKLGISARRQSVLQLNDRSNATTLAMRALLACSESAKLAIVRNKFYQDLLMESRVHSNAILAASLQKKRNQRIVSKSEGQLMRALLLLKHFSFGSRVCSDVLQQEGVVELIRTQFSAHPKGSFQVRNSALGLLVNIVANSSAACLEVLETKVPTKGHQSSFFMQLVGIWESKKSLAPLSRLSGFVLQALLQVHESRTAILKTDFVSRMVSILERLLKKKDLVKFSCALRFLSDLAAFKESRSFLLHHPLFSDLMEYVLSAGDLDANNEAMEEILLFLRNMSFSQDMKTYLSSKNEALQVLLNQIYNFSSSPKMASCAANALWVLLYKSQKMKACVKTLDGANERLLGTEAELALLGRKELGAQDAAYVRETQSNLHQVSAILQGGQQDLE